jgi:hypothetical protein
MNFGCPMRTVSRFWERTGADLVQPTSLTSGNAAFFVRRVGATALEEGGFASGATNPWATEHVLT